MTAAYLRETARLIRRRAQAATPGPWRVSSDEATRPQVLAGNDRRVAARVGVPTETARQWNPADAPHVAAWHPGVALAVADHLDAAGADLFAYGPLHCADGCHECDDDIWAPHVRRALAVARAWRGDA